MTHRNRRVSSSVALAVVDDDEADNRLRIWRRLRAFFRLYGLVLIKVRPELFRGQRNQTWQIMDEEYKSSFTESDSLASKGDMGYSGSTFFVTKDNKYLIKSVPRQFEHSFFRDELLEPYISHVETHPGSLLVHITDFLAWRYRSLGGILGVAPTHHLVMENLLVGQDADSAWQTFDLKPTSYFFPERDIAGGRLASEATLSRLADEFHDKLLLSREQAGEFLQQLEADTALLARHNAVDYSLMLVRIPRPAAAASSSSSPSTNDDDPFADPPTWRSGVPSQDGRWLFRAVILDFFWAKHKVRAQAMTLLVRAWNLVDRQGPMSITTTAHEYRGRFLDMCRQIVEVQDRLEPGMGSR